MGLTLMTGRWSMALSLFPDTKNHNRARALAPIRPVTHEYPCVTGRWHLCYVNYVLLGTKRAQAGLWKACASRSMVRRTMKTCWVTTLDPAVITYLTIGHQLVHLLRRGQHVLVHVVLSGLSGMQVYLGIHSTSMLPGRCTPRLPTSPACQSSAP
jgi:hypothetical protein